MSARVLADQPLRTSLCAARETGDARKLVSPPRVAGHPRPLLLAIARFWLAEAVPVVGLFKPGSGNDRYSNSRSTCPRAPVATAIGSAFLSRTENNFGSATRCSRCAHTRRRRHPGTGIRGRVISDTPTRPLCGPGCSQYHARAGIMRARDELAFGSSASRMAPPRSLASEWR